MAKKGEQKILKRIAVSKLVPIHNRKERTFLTKPIPGPHNKTHCMPIVFVLRDILGIVSNLKEAEYLLYMGKIKVDGKVRKEPGFPIGIMDILEIGDKHYMIKLDDKGRLNVTVCDKKDQKLLKITKKRTIKKGVTQITFHDGRTIQTNDSKIKVGDSALVDLNNMAIVKYYPLKTDSDCLIVEGKHAGSIGKLKSVEYIGGRKEAVLTIKDEKIITRWDYLFALDESYSRE